MRLADKFGGEVRVKAMHARLLEFAKGFGITDFTPRERSPNTRRALAIAELARDRGVLPKFRDLAMDAHWRKGMDLESDADLRAIAAEAGLDPGEAIAASRDPVYLGRIDDRREEAEARGVTGIPTFVIGNQGVVGCQPYEVLAEFVESCGGRRK